MSWFARTPLDGVRWAVVDCETSGLDATRDRLLAVGAVPVRAGRIELAGAYSALVRQARASEPANIVLHGIGGEAQTSGQPLEQVRGELAVFMEGAVPVAFHAPFDAQVLRRHGVRPAKPWLDLAQLAPALFPAEAAHHRALDDWLRRFEIAPAARHDALGDAYATAQLLLALLFEARRQGATTLERVFAAAKQARWLPR